MNKISNINLGGYPITIDNDAYTLLENYLAALHRHFSTSEGCEEIINDIEIRMAELLQERAQGKAIVTIKDVQQVIGIMGTPEDFANDSDPATDDANTNHQRDTSKEFRFDERGGQSYQTGKRLFRDPDDKVVGGVCSGLAAYFGIQDPVWVRLLFVVMLLSGGFGAAIYIALMIIVPYAKTSTDRLAMRGEKIDIENIAKIVEDGFQSVSQKFAEFGTDDEKKKATSGVGGNFSGKIFLSNVFGFLGEVFRALLQTLAKVGRPILIVIGAILIISLIISWLGMLFGFYFSLPFLSYVTPNSGFRSAMGMTNSLVVIAIPILALIFLIVRLAYRTKINSNIKAGMWSFWFINLISLGFVATSFVREFKSRVEVNNSVDLSNVQSDSLLHFTVFKPDVVRESNIQFFDTELYDDALLNRNVYLDIRTSDDDKFHVSEKHIALGANLQEANSLAANISKLVSVQPDQTLSLIPSFLIPKGQKWRAQEVAVTIEVPKGKHLRFGDGFQWQHNGRFELSQKNDEEGVEWHSFENHLWRMEADGLYCVDCERQFSEEAQEVEEK